MQIALNDPAEYEGGQLVFVKHPQKGSEVEVAVPPRPPGAMTAHEPCVMHGVVPLTKGTRKALSVVDKDNGLGDRDVCTVTAEQVAAFRKVYSTLVESRRRRKAAAQPSGGEGGGSAAGDRPSPLANLVVEPGDGTTAATAIDVETSETQEIAAVVANWKQPRHGGGGGEGGVTAPVTKKVRSAEAEAGGRGLRGSQTLVGGGPAAGTLCVICMDEPRQLAVLPCLHYCVCIGCAKALMAVPGTTQCPLCRKTAEDFRAVHF